MRFIFTLILLGTWQAQANVVGVDAQNFNPTTSGLDFVTVHSSKTLSPGVMNFGMFFNYAVNTLPNYENKQFGSFTQPNDALTSMDLNMGIGLMNNWDMGISLPQVLRQDVDENNTTYHGQFANTGINEIRVNSKYRVWDGTSQGLAVVGSANFFLIQDYPYTGKNPGPTYNLEVAYDNTYNNFTWGVNIGYRIRSPGDAIQAAPGDPALPTPAPNQYLASIATSYYFTDLDFKLIAEIFASRPTRSVDYSSVQDMSSAEFILGGKFDILYNLAAHIGAGTQLFQGSSSPDYRVYAGVNWSLGPLFSSNEKPPASDYFSDAMTEQVYTEQPKYIDDATAFESLAPAAEESFLAKNILFEFNGTRVNPEFDHYLKNLAEYLLKGSVFTELVIIGHTDSVGSDAYNLNLSLKRAEAVKERVQSFLPEQHRGKIRAEGEGERSPIASNKNYQGRALNRRVEFFIKR
jgi:outer membrane protein OmpA-like peptidoglycan-associated protein